MASVRIDPKVGRIHKLPLRAPQEQARVFAAAARQVAGRITLVLFELELDKLTQFNATAQRDIIASSSREEQRIKIGCQSIMEEALFDFCQKWCKDLLHGMRSAPPR